ncbi:MAG: glycosyltransferase, partial [Deltaproteobacteria bacterium]|nr:glycosyltransferase [Deltaproteobacteria bacterium]
PRDRSILAEFGVPPDALVVLSLARLIEWKGHDVLARAMGAVPGAWLVQAGGEESPAWRERVMGIAREVGVGDRFVIAGIRPDVARLLGAAEVLAHSSKYDRAEQGVVEAFGRVIVEAMAAGVPVVATDVGGAAEIFRHENGTPWTHDAVAPGRLVPAGNSDAMAAAIRHFLDHPDDARRAGEAGRVRARDYDERVTARKIAEVFEDVFRRTPRV